ncbi:hypothetical protein ABFY60_04045 [Lysinibacillus pakistanensis]|uniref:hypothetical protein n=1 Tax=Lysinibacillus pakistanensis TaxID=759811 RepID=UPI003D2686E0
MIVKTKDLYGFEQAAEILGVSTQRLFELTVSPYVEKVHIENRTYFTKESMRYLLLRGDI